MFGLPAAASRLGYQSRPEKIPFSTVPGLTWPGQRQIVGRRKPPSKMVPFVALNGVIPAYFATLIATKSLMSAFGTKQTLISTPNMSAFGGQTDIPDASPMSANDPKRTLRRVVRGVTPTNARRHRGWLSFDGGVPEEGQSTLFVSGKPDCTRSRA